MNLYGYAGSDPVNHIDSDGTGPWTALGVEAACQAYALYQFYSTASQLAALADQVAALKKRLGSAQDQEMCDTELSDDPTELQQQIARLSLDFAKQQAMSEAAFAAQEVICAALGAAALEAPTP
jgi:hypothetical protein